MAPMKSVNTHNLASLLIWQIYQEYENALSKKEQWGDRLQKMERLREILVSISLLSLCLVLAYWGIFFIFLFPTSTTFWDYVSGGIMAIPLMSCLSIMLIEQRVVHYQHKIREVDKGVVEFIKKRLNQILLSHTCFAHDDVDAIIDFYYNQLGCIVGDFFKENFASPLSHEEEEEIKSWIKTSWPNFFISP